MIHIFDVGERVRTANPGLKPLTGTVLDISRHKQITVMQTDQGDIYAFDTDDLERE